MNLRRKRADLHDLVGAAGRTGHPADTYAPGTATVAMLGIWMIGATLVNVLPDPPGRR